MTEVIDTSLAVPAQAGSIEALLLTAVQAGATVDQLERLMELRRQLQAEASKRAYDEAMARFQRDCPIIEKDRAVNIPGGAKYKYAELPTIIRQVRGLLADCGFSYAIDTETIGSDVEVVCTAKHQAGHSETSRVKIPSTSRAGMSEAQKVASAITFAKRYAFCNAFGIMTGDEDDDNVSARTDLPRQAGGYTLGVAPASSVASDEPEVPYSTPEERREMRAKHEAENQHLPKRVTEQNKQRSYNYKDVRVEMLGGGTMYPDADKPCTVIKVLHRSKEIALTHYKHPSELVERIKAAGYPDVYDPTQHKGPITVDIVATPDGKEWRYVASNLRVEPAAAELPPPSDDLGPATTVEELMAEQAAKGK